MSKLTDALNNKLKIYNPYGLVERGHPILSYYSPDPGRSVEAHGWFLMKKGFRYSGPWYNQGNLKIISDGGKAGRDESLQRALAKCKELFPDLEMVKAPWPWTWIPKVDLDRVIDLMKEK